MKVRIVGCAGSFPAPGSAASCYLVEADGARVVLDLGSGALGPLQMFVAPADIDAVLLSHLHPDHCLDLCGLYVALKYDPRGTPAERLAVFGPTGTLERLDAAYGADEQGKIASVFDVREWTDGGTHGIGPLSVTPRRVRHPVEAYGMRVEGPAEDGGPAVLAYTGDTDSCPALAELAAGADLLIAEASFQEGRDTTPGVHLTGRRAGELAAEAGVRRLVLTHLPTWTDPAVVLAEARGAFDGPVALAEAGQTYDL